MEPEKQRYWQRLRDALLNRTPKNSFAPTLPDSPITPLTEEETTSRVAGLLMDLQERDDLITEMRADYANLQNSSERHTAEAGEKAMEELLRRLVNTLTQIARMDALSKHGKRIEVTDVFALASDIERELKRVGLERIGSALEEVAFDSTLHQRMSGNAPQSDTKVVIQSPGYCFRGRILLKAMISTSER